ncbi:MAG TPA: hypothetical protein VJN18_25065 [Polyangiaceae bacterium]|nr:hypothetical protein [Polyangiaceae bacterium]
MSAITGMDDNTAQCVCDHIASACDQFAEAVSNMHEEQPPGYHDVCEALTTLYKLRAEIGFFGGKVVADLTEPVESGAAE